MSERPFQGLRTAIYCVDDLDRAKAWYGAVLETKPYFDQPFYVGFNVGGYELGLNPDTSRFKPGGGGVFTYWGVADCAASLARLLVLGARQLEPAQDVGGGIVVATVLDPFGNVFGIIQNPHFELAGAAAAQA